MGVEQLARTILRRSEVRKTCGYVDIEKLALIGREIREGRRG